MSQLPPPIRAKASAIGHAGRLFFCPLSEAKADWLIRMMLDHLAPDAEVLDLGCGRAGFLRRLLAARADLLGVGVDVNETAVAEAAAASSADGLEGRLEVAAEAAAAFLRRGRRFDALLSIGASQAVGGFDALASVASEVLRPNGLLLVGDGFWRAPPSSDYLAVLGAEPDELASHAENAERLRGRGLTLMASATASADEWDDYEGDYLKAKVLWARTHPEDPDSGIISADALSWHDAYLRWGRATLGFGWYLAIL